MDHPLISQELVASAAKTASGDSGAINLPVRGQDSVLIEFACTAVTGTSPTLDLYIQESLDGGVTFVDIAHFAQATAALTNPSRLRLSARNVERASDAIVTGVGDATTAAASLSGIPLISNALRVKWVVGGTSPSFTIAVKAYY